MTYERDRADAVAEHEATGLGTILGIILAIAVVLAIIWFFFLGGLGNSVGTDPASGADATVQTHVLSGPNTNTQR
jgi:hypothetical protein